MPSYRHQRDGKRLKAGEHPVRFSVFYRGDNTHRRMLASNPWRCMELELVRQNSSSEDCLAYLRQAHDFSVAAEAAKATARPVLMYYSFLNLAKMLIKYRDKQKNLAQAIHGLTEAPENAQRQRVTLTAQSVVIKTSRKRIPILKEFASVLKWQLRPAETRYNVCDLLAQVPAIHRPYSHTRKRAERLYVISDAEFRYDHFAREAWAILWVRRSEFGGRNAYAKLSSRVYFDEWFKQVEADESHDNAIPFETEACHYGKSPCEALTAIGEGCIKAGVLAILAPNGYRYYLSNFEPRHRVHQLLASYMAMFYFGSVARYRPADYEKMLKSKYGWVIEEFLATQGYQFVYLMANQVLGQEVVCPWAVRGSEPHL